MVILVICNYDYALLQIYKPTKKTIINKTNLEVIYMAKEANSVFVGRRPTMNYVMATMMILNKGEECTVKARGRAISHAVDVCEILRNRFLKGTEYKDIKLSTEQLEGENGQSNNVSSIEIVLAPPK
jgi:DNA-binding protein